MNRHDRVFISHTTKDKRDHNLARRLGHGLEERGARVWIAPESIPAGAKWKEKIVSAVMDRCTHFLVILSAASIKAGWVLNEIALAEERSKQDSAFKVLPLIVGQVDRYPGKTFIDTLQRVPYHDSFKEQFDTIIQELGLPPNLPDEFRTFVAERTAGFVGREYVFDAINEFLAKQNKGYFILEGDPGEGKSAILAEYVRRTGCIAHFNIRADGITLPSQFLDNVGSQLITRYHVSERDVKTARNGEGGRLRRLLEDVSEQLECNRKLVIAVDALDEVDQSTQKSGVNILYLPSVLPKGVYFVMTRRRMTPSDMPFTVYCPQRSFDLMNHKTDCEKDIQTYLLQATERPRLAAWISARDLEVDTFVAQLGEKSERNFMYLHYVLPELENGAYQDLDIQNLPVGLEGYYDDHWGRMIMRNQPVPRDKVNIVYILSAVRQPVSRDLLLHFAREENPDLNAIMVQQILDDWRQFLHEQTENREKRYSVYHTSFRDFLHRKDIVTAAGVSVEEIHKMIADSLWPQ